MDFFRTSRKFELTRRVLNQGGHLVFFTFKIIIGSKNKQEYIYPLIQFKTSHYIKKFVCLVWERCAKLNYANYEKYSLKTNLSLFSA